MAAAHRLLVALLAAPAFLSADQSFLRAAAESNVNQRYTVESISIAGIEVQRAQLPPTLRSRFIEMIGERCDFVRLQEAAAELRQELHLRGVSQSLLRGSEPGRIRVNFEVVQKPVAFDVSVPQIVFNLSHGWSGQLDATARTGHNSLRMSVLTSGADLVERDSGVAARFENSKLGTDRLRFRLDLESYQTERVDYRTRHNIAPQVSFAVSKPVTVSAGLSFQQIDGRAANAITGQLRYGRRIEGGTIQQSIEGKYNLRAATASLGSDFTYSRHSVSLRYEWKAGKQTATDELSAGSISGQAPSFERFVLGNRFAYDAQGGSRLVHNSVTWGYQLAEGTAEAFYNAGVLWRGGRNTPVRHSVGAGFRQGVFMIAVAFPVGERSVTPVFIAGVNY